MVYVCFTIRSHICIQGMGFEVLMVYMVTTTTVLCVRFFNYFCIVWVFHQQLLLYCVCVSSTTTVLCACFFNYYCIVCVFLLPKSGDADNRKRKKTVHTFWACSPLLCKQGPPQPSQAHLLPHHCRPSHYAKSEKSNDAHLRKWPQPTNLGNFGQFFFFRKSGFV